MPEPKKSGRGGRRPGAGRKVGAINRITKKAFEAAQESGETPDQFLLRVSRGDVVDGVKPTFAHRIDAAKAVLPFLMPKLSAVGIKAVGPDNPWPELLDMVDGARRKPPSENTPGG